MEKVKSPQRPLARKGTRDQHLKNNLEQEY